ncbi:MAG: hypothetical protein LBL15_04185 [Oscillospiraceae bacterium]|jgi:N-acetylglucosamine kinase-like BadF-type ATPase|nr:hypothetical protein [Oscillospiraceae bacterium]
MSDSRYFLGLDGGGTKTHCVLYDYEKDSLGFFCGGPTNHEVLPNGMESLPGAIGAVVVPLLSQAGIGIGEVDGAALGMGGVDMPMQHDLIRDIVAEMGFRNFGICNDGYLGIRAECGGTGICAVNGSGCSVVGISPGGRTFQIGGHGDMSGDKGGGGYLVPAAMRAVYSALFKKGPRTLLTDLMFEWLGIGERMAFSQAAAVQILNDQAAAYHSISQLLYRAAGRGDPEALRILTVCGEDYALSIRCVAEELGLRAPIDTVLVGSQFKKCENDHAIKTMRQALNPPGTPLGFRLKLISTAPVAGALLWALELGDRPAGQALRDSLKTRLASLEGCE